MIAGPAPMAWMLRSPVHQGLGPAESNLFEELVVLYTYYDYLDLPPGASAARIEAAYQTIKQRLDAAGDHVGDRRQGASIGNVHEL